MPRLSHGGRYFATLIAATFLMGSSFIAGKILLAAGVPSMLLVGWRFLVAALATLPFVSLDGSGFSRSLWPRKLTMVHVMSIALIGALQTAGVMGLLFIAMRTVSASTAAILLFTNPIWVALLARFFLSEPFDGARLIALCTGVAGVIFAIGFGGAPAGGGASGKLIALASSMCWACATIVNKRAHVPIGPWGLSFWQMLLGSLILLAQGYAAGERWPSALTSQQWGWFVWLAVPASTGSFGLWFAALHEGGAMRSSAYLFLAPFFAVILSAVLLSARLGWSQGIGGVLIGLSLWLINRGGGSAPGPTRWTSPTIRK